MRVAILTDIHSNLTALEAVLAQTDEAGVDARWCLGDVVGYGAQPDDCARLASERCDICLVGNHDLAVTGEIDTEVFSASAAAAVEWTVEHCDKATMEFLKGLKPEDTSQPVGLYHASPRDPVWEYVLAVDQASECMEEQSAPVSLIGHSHVALYFTDGAGNGRHGRPGARRPRDRPHRGPLAAEPRQRRPAARRRPARGVARAGHRGLEGDLPPRRVRDRRSRRAPIRAAGLPDLLADRLYIGQ